MTKRELKTAMAQNKGLPEGIKCLLFDSVKVSQPSMQVAIRNIKSEKFEISSLGILCVKGNTCMEVSYFNLFHDPPPKNVFHLNLIFWKVMGIAHFGQRGLKTPKHDNFGLKFCPQLPRGTANRH